MKTFFCLAVIPKYLEGGLIIVLKTILKIFEILSYLTVWEVFLRKTLVECSGSVCVCGLGKWVKRWDGWESSGWLREMGSEKKEGKMPINNDALVAFARLR